MENLQDGKKLMEARPRIIKKCLLCGCDFECFDLQRWSRNYCEACILVVRAEQKEIDRSVYEAMQPAQVPTSTGIPPLWKDVSFDNSNDQINQIAFRICHNYAESFDPAKSPSLVLFTLSYGSGKTHLAICIVNYVLRVKKLYVLFKRARDILLEIRSSYNDGYTLEQVSTVRIVPRNMPA